MCEHSKTIDDLHSGDTVCCDCGLVLQERITMGNACASLCGPSSPPPPLVRSSSTETVASEWESGLLGDHRVVRNEMLETCARLHISDAYVADNAVDMMRYLVVNKGRMMNLAAKRQVFAFALYETLNRMGIPRTPQLIAHSCGISPSALLRVESELNAG